MSYEIKVMYGENTNLVKVDGIISLSLIEGVYFLYDTEGEVVFTGPKEFVVYICKK